MNKCGLLTYPSRMRYISLASSLANHGYSSLTLSLWQRKGEHQLSHAVASATSIKCKVTAEGHVLGMVCGKWVAVWTYFQTTQDVHEVKCTQSGQRSSSQSTKCIHTLSSTLHCLFQLLREKNVLTIRTVAHHSKAIVLLYHYKLLSCYNFKRRNDFLCTLTAQQW